MRQNTDVHNSEADIIQADELVALVDIYLCVHRVVLH